MLQGIPSGNIQKLQRVQNSAARIVLQAPRQSHTKPLLRQLHWLPVQHRITYKSTVLTYKVRTTSTPAYLNRHIRLRESLQILRSTMSSVHSIVRTVRQYSFCQACFQLFCVDHSGFDIAAACYACWFPLFLATTSDPMCTKVTGRRLSRYTCTRLCLQSS